MKWVDTLLTPTETTTKVLCLDIAFGVLRDFSTQYMMEGAETALETTTIKYPRHKKMLRYLADAICEIQQELVSEREKYILIYSYLDDQYDLLSVKKNN